MTIWRPMRTISMTIPEELLIEIDEVAKNHWYNRSECMRRLLADALTKYDTDAVKKLRRKNPLDPRLLDLDDS